jgi:hypothetical protein
VREALGRIGGGGGRPMLASLVTAAVVVAGAAAATSKGITALRARFYTDHVHFGLKYRGYQQPPVDIRVYRTSGAYHRIADHRRLIGRTWRMVYSTDKTGFGGLAVFNVFYDVDLHARCTPGRRRLNYVAVFRLFNPATDVASDRYRYSFYVNCA